MVRCEAVVVSRVGNLFISSLQGNMLSESPRRSISGFGMDEFYVHRGTAARRHVTAKTNAATRRNVTASDLLERCSPASRSLRLPFAVR
jgi:hypothetical protein